MTAAICACCYIHWRETASCPCSRRSMAAAIYNAIYEVNLRLLLYWLMTVLYLTAVLC